MSVAAIVWAWQQECEPGPKFVLVALADNANDAGECWPGINSLMKKTCMSRRTVVRHLAELEQLNLISKEERHRKDGGQTSNLYYLKMQVAREQVGLEPYPDGGGANPTRGGCQSDTGGVPE